MKPYIEWGGCLCVLEEGEIESLKNSKLEAKLLKKDTDKQIEGGVRLILAQSDSCHEFVRGEYSPEGSFFVNAEKIRYTLSPQAYEKLIEQYTRRITFFIGPEERLIIEKSNSSG